MVTSEEVSPLIDERQRSEVDRLVLALAEVVELLKPLEPEQRWRVLCAVAVLNGMDDAAMEMLTTKGKL